MTIKTKAQIMAENIANRHDKDYFNIQEGADIIGCGRNTFARLLSDAGVLVRKVGTSKRISAYDLAMLMERDRIASYENGR